MAGALGRRCAWIETYIFELGHFNPADRTAIDQCRAYADEEDAVISGITLEHCGGAGGGIEHDGNLARAARHRDWLPMITSENGGSQ